MTQYNVDHDFSSPYRVLETTRPLLYLPGSLRSLQVQFEKSLLAYFDRYTVDEWIEQHIKPLIKSVEDLNKKAEVLTSKTAWPQRPLGFKETVEKDKNTKGRAMAESNKQ